MMENQVSSEDSSAVYTLKNEMTKAGYTDIATSVGIRTLTKIGMIETYKEVDNWNNDQEYIACKLLEKGESWILSNQDQLEFRKRIVSKYPKLITYHSRKRHRTTAVLI